MKRVTFFALALLLLFLASCSGEVPTQSTAPQSTSEETEGYFAPSTSPAPNQKILLPLQDKSTLESEKKVAVFVLLGQSNAGGYGLDLAPNEQITTPLKNVYGLDRTKNSSTGKLSWSGYTSDKMNACDYEDHVQSVATCLARSWQSEIDHGKDLPDLYIVHIALGGQGITKEFGWNPPSGKLFTQAKSTLARVKTSLEQSGKQAEFIGLHWIGGEGDLRCSTASLKRDLKGLYLTFFNQLFSSIGHAIPTVLYRINSVDYYTDDDSAYNLIYTNSLFEELSVENEAVTVFDTRTAPCYQPDVVGDGLFGSDKLHYTAEVTNWIAEQILLSYQK